MGLLDIFKNAVGGGGGSEMRKGPAQKCPQCGETVLLNMERCPKCGTRIKSMFRRKCPKCNTLNELEAKRCSQCRYDFEAELERASRTYFVCPICGYKNEAFLTHCPGCNTKFI